MNTFGNYLLPGGAPTQQVAPVNIQGIGAQTYGGFAPSGYAGGPTMQGAPIPGQAAPGFGVSPSPQPPAPPPVHAMQQPALTAPSPSYGLFAQGAPRGGGGGANGAPALDPRARFPMNAQQWQDLINGYGHEIGSTLGSIGNAGQAFMTPFAQMFGGGQAAPALAANAGDLAGTTLIDPGLASALMLA